MSIFRGSGVAIVTPMKQNGDVDFNALEKLINFQIENKTDAIITCGTTGEPSTLSAEEHLEVIEFTVSKVNKRVPVIAGTGSNDTKHGIKMTKAAEKLGADACLLVTPYYNKTTQKGLYEHFCEFAKNVHLPLILYNVPSRTCLNIDPETVFKLSKIENIVAIKEASGNITQILEIKNLCGDSIDLYSGNDDQIFPILSIGGLGVISVVANILPKETHDIVYKYLEGDLKGSLQLQLKLMHIIKELFREVSPIPIKTALKHMGFESCNLRLPLTTMEEKNEKLLIEEMKIIGLIK